LRIFCDECLIEPALIDHLDLSPGLPRLRRLCAVCAEQERARWAKDRLERPLGPPAQPEKDQKAA
jgi:hypothetical protein